MIGLKHRIITRMDEHEESDIKKYYNNGYNIKEIANKLNISEVVVYNAVVDSHKMVTEEERDEMVSLFNMGYSYSAIAKIFNKSRACVKDRINNPAKINYTSSETITDEQLNTIKEMASNGMSFRKIHETTGISIYSIRYRLSHTNIRNVTPHVSEREAKLFIKLHKEGKTNKEIAKLTGRSTSAVGKHLNRAGYYSKPRRR